MQRLSVGAALFLLPLSTAAQELRLPAIIADHMVVQRGQPARIWGRTSPEGTVRVRASWSEAPVDFVAGTDGRFTVELPAPETSGPHTIEVSAGGAVRLVRDVLAGEVWLCGGQSNMEWTLGPGVGPGVRDWQREVAAAEWPQIRFFDVPNTVATDPREDCGGQWVVCSPETAGKFSAVGYFFGREVHRELKAPVGLVGCNWGGTVLEAWMPYADVEEFGEFGEALAEVQAARSSVPVPERQRAWFERLRSVDGGERAGWQQAQCDPAGWQEQGVPGTWAADLGGFDGVVWYRREVEVPEAFDKRPLVLELGNIDDLDSVWWNGVPVGGTDQGEAPGKPRRYVVPGELVLAGTAVIAVRVVDVGGAGGFTSPAEAILCHPEGDRAAALPLAGTWRIRRGAELRAIGSWPRPGGPHQNTPSVLYAGMVAPIVRLGLRGVIFYQGESNVGRPEQYRRLFPAMIDGWRRAFGQPRMPFYYVQIAPYEYGGRTALAAFLREAQALAMAQVDHVGMAVTMDIGDPKDIHPANKQDVGRRLALWALAKTYGREGIEPSGPVLSGHAAEDGGVRLRFAHAAGLKTSDGRPPSHFTIAGADRVFHPAEATIEGETVVVRSAAVPQPVAVRYAFGAADQPNLVNGAGLPAPSFRTDDWPPPQ